MYQWTTLRTLAGLLLCLPLIHFAYIASRDVSRYLDPSPSVWDSDIRALVARDLDAAIPPNPILVIGGQRVRLWQELPTRLAPRDTLLRPLGDATLEDLTHHYDRLVGFYRPSILVIFPGYADLHVRDSKSPQRFRESLRRLLELDEKYGSTSERYLIAPLRMPLYPADDERIAAMTAEARALAEELPDLTVIDPNPELLGSDGRPDPGFYRGDGINLNPGGYARVTMLLQAALRARRACEPANPCAE